MFGIFTKSRTKAGAKNGSKKRAKRRRIITHTKDTTAEYVQYKEQARTLVHQKLVQWNALYNFSYNRVSIKNQKTRWGSCSSKGNLNFHYRIVFLPEPLVDYLIVHELCHLGQMNHSKAFWDLVEKTIPDYSIRQNMLRNISVR